MRGIERRSEGRGRRATDHPGLWGRPYERALILAALLILSMALLLVARDQSRPEREVDALMRETLSLDAHVFAQTVAAQLGDMDRLLTTAEAGYAAQPERALSAMELAARNLSGSALLLTTAQGTPLVAVGKNTRAVEGISYEEGRLHLARKTRDGKLLAVSAPAPAPTPTVADTRLELHPKSQLPPTLFGDGAILPDPQGKGRMTKARLVGDSGLAVVADRPAPTVFERWRDDARLLVIPLAAGVALLLFFALQIFRQDRRRREWGETERRFRIAVEAAQCGVWDWDMEKGHITFSDYMTALFEVPTGSVLTHTEIIDRIHPHYRDGFVAAMAEARLTGHFDLAFPLPLADGGVRWIDVRGRARLNPRRGEFSHLMGIALDVTEARRIKAKAQAAENRLIDGIQSVSDAFVLFDRQGHLVMWNQAFQDAFDFPKGALYRGALKNDLNRIAAQAIRSEQKSEQRRAGVREVELKDGRWLQMTERFTGDGGTVVIAADVTLIRQQENERRRAAEELQRTVNALERSRASLATLAKEYEAAMTRAEAASQSKSEFLANMSHELRTPLNAINGFSEIMAQEMFGPLGDRRYKGYAVDIHTSGKHLLSLINDILDMAKIEAGKLNLYYERTDMAALGREVVHLMRGRAEEAGLALTLDAPDVVEAEVDLRGMKQVLLNLVSNAIKFTPRAGRVMLELTPLMERPGVVRVAIRDTGIGIAAEDIKRLAQPFVQVENQHAKTTQGTGLGLALTKSLIEIHGSEMTIESELGTGTTVWFDIPVKSVKTAQGLHPAPRLHTAA
ncbi:PAS domain-containing sensor histidine kinase [Brevundimonas sp. GN22]